MVLLFMQTQSLNLCTFRYIFMKYRLRLSFSFHQFFQWSRAKFITIQSGSLSKPHLHISVIIIFQRHSNSWSSSRLQASQSIFLTSIAFFITSGAALQWDGIYLCRLQVEIHFPTSKSRYASDESESTPIPWSSSLAPRFSSTELVWLYHM